VFVGLIVGFATGTLEGFGLGETGFLDDTGFFTVGWAEGRLDGFLVGFRVGLFVGFFVGANGFLVGFLLGEATVGATGALIKQAFALFDHMP